MFHSLLIKLYFAVTHLHEKPESGERRPEGKQVHPEQDYNVLSDEGGASKWQEYTDDATGAPYWHNPETGVSTWTKPADAD